MSWFASVGDDVLQNILSRLPAKSFGLASCVNRCWNTVCKRIVSKPMLASALSLNNNLHVAVREVLDKVLSKPIRPHFAIAFVGLQFCLQKTHQLIIETLGPNVPVITNAAGGIIGMDAITDELKEVKWEYFCPEHMNLGGQNPINNLNQGITLLVGYVPGLKVDIIPLLHPKMESPRSMVDKFVNDVWNYTASVSNRKTPVGIILFGDHRTDMRPVIAEIDYAMPEETVIVGDACSCFLWRSGEASRNFDPNLYIYDAVGLVFVRDNKKNQGEIRFHVTISTGIIPFGPRLEIVSLGVQDRDFTWLTARMEGELDILDGLQILESIYDEVDDELHSLYIGVMKQRKSSTGSKNAESGRYLAFHEVLGAEQEVFIVAGAGLDPGDSFFFYHSDSDTAKSSCVEACNNLNNLKSYLYAHRTSFNPTTSTSFDTTCSSEIFGGMIFACSGRGERFFGKRNVDCMPFLLSSPGVPVGGAFCYGEIGRPAVSEADDGDVRCSMKVYSTVYLAMSYVPD